MVCHEPMFLFQISEKLKKRNWGKRKNIKTTLTKTEKRKENQLITKYFSVLKVIFHFKTKKYFFTFKTEEKETLKKSEKLEKKRKKSGKKTLVMTLSITTADPKASR